MNKNKNNDVDYILSQIKELRKLLDYNKNQKSNKPKINYINEKENSFEKIDTRISGENNTITKNIEDSNLNLDNNKINEKNIETNSKTNNILNNLENHTNLLILENARLREEKLKALADLENHKKMLNQEFDEYKKYSNLNFAKSLLNVLDNFERALLVDNVSPEVKNFLIGFRFIYKNITDVFRNENILEIPTKLGDDFDSHIHLVIERIETKKYKSGTIVQILQKGYKLHNRIIKPVSVNVEK